jgi:hypothetical protein
MQEKQEEIDHRNKKRETPHEKTEHAHMRARDKQHRCP